MTPNQQKLSHTDVGRTANIPLTPHNQGGVGIYLAISVLVLLLANGTVHAQPVDLCSQTNGITLQIGGTDEVEVSVPANTSIKVTIISDCETTPTNPPAYNGVFPSGGNPGTDYDSTPITWSTNYAGEHDGEWYVGIDVWQDAVFTLTLDACLGTIVRIECQ